MTHGGMDINTFEDCRVGNELSNSRHCAGDEHQIGVVRDREFDFVPDVRKKRQRIVVNDLFKHFFVRKLDETYTRMITRNVLTAEFPEGGIQVTNIDYIARGVTNLNAITHTKRLTDENIDPTDEAFHRGLYSQANDD